MNRHLQKSPVSGTELSQADDILQRNLPFQEVDDHAKPVVRPALPPDMLLHPENKQATLLHVATAKGLSGKHEFLISLIRSGVSGGDLLMQAAVHTLVSSAVVPMMRAGFLPIIPRPITECVTVSHCLSNIQCLQTDEPGINGNLV